QVGAHGGGRLRRRERGGEDAPRRCAPAYRVEAPLPAVHPLVLHRLAACSEATRRHRTLSVRHEGDQGGKGGHGTTELDGGAGATARRRVAPPHAAWRWAAAPALARPGGG